MADTHYNVTNEALTVSDKQQFVERESQQHKYPDIYVFIYLHNTCLSTYFMYLHSQIPCSETPSVRV